MMEKLEQVTRSPQVLKTSLAAPKKRSPREAFLKPYITEANHHT